MIKGGYILQPRIIDKSNAAKMPPVAREVWGLVLRGVNFADNDKFKRGQGFFNISDIMESLSWFVGYRKMTYSKTQVAKALRRLCEDSLVTTAKTTRGLIVTVCNYEYYQDPKNYEDYNEETTKTQRRPRHDDTIHKKVKNEKNVNKTTNNIVEKPSVLNGSAGEVFTYWQKVLNHPKAKLDDKRRKKINALLKIGYTPEDLKTAIDGCKSSPFHQGQNKQSAVYDDIELILRDASHVDRFIKTASLAGSSTQLSQYGKRAVEVSKSWLEKSNGN